MSNTGNYGLSLFGIDPFGSGSAVFGVASATSYSPHFVQVRFTDLFDPSDTAFTDPGNYGISPPLAVNAVIIESAGSVVLETDAQSLVTYTVTVAAGRSFAGIPMIPPNNTADFTGSPLIVGYTPVATSSTRVRCIFNTEMLLNAALSDPTSYTVTDLNGIAVPVISAQPEQPGPGPLSVVLTLGVELQTTTWYQTILNSGIVDINGHAPQPSAVDFQWVLPVLTVSVPIPEFSGEVSGGPFGDHNGLVFFSPSLNVAAPNSIIQVEDVSVCTTAYDQYRFPAPRDPSPFYIWSPLGPHTVLGQPGIVLFRDLLGEARFSLEFTASHQIEYMPEPFDGSCSIVMRAGFAPGYVSLLNNLTWTLFNGTSTVPPMFICANNLAPIPVGPETIIVLHQAMVGRATMTVQEPQLVHWAATNIHADSNLATIPELAPTNLAANSYMRVGRPHLQLGASVAIVGQSALVDHSPQNFSASAEIEGYAIVRARVDQDWQVAATFDGNSSIFTRASRDQHLVMNTAGTSAFIGAASVGQWLAAAVIGNSFVLPPGQTAGVITGASTATAVAVVQHNASASLAGSSAMVAEAT